MAANYVLLEKITVGAAGASSVIFNSIPQTGYTDLVLKCSARTNRASFDEVIAVSFNGSTSSFSWKLLNVSGSSTPGSYNGTTNIMAGRAVAATATASTFSNSEVYIPNYASSNYKSFSVDSVAENNSSTLNDLDLHAGLWSNTAAITSITLTPASGGVFDQYTTFYLYGVAKLGTIPAIQPYATGGDTIMTDGTYWYHAFKSSGTFTPAKGLSCDVLVVAGGGGGAGSDGGGGGAGGVSYLSGASLTTTAYTATVGAGGANGTSGGTNGTNGSNSVFSGITSNGGGGGGTNGANGLSGGSGGGGGANRGTGGAATQGSTGGATGYGFAGGTSSNSVYNISGGGGAGAVGVSASAAAPPVTQGNGGAGLNTWSSWLSTTGLGVSGYIAGGGGAGFDSVNGGSAGLGGSGGGGNGGTGTVVGTSGVANTGGGGGGGGGSPSNNGGSGGSGLVIIRYAI